MRGGQEQASSIDERVKDSCTHVGVEVRSGAQFGTLVQTRREEKSSEMRWRGTAGREQLFVAMTVREGEARFIESEWAKLRLWASRADGRVRKGWLRGWSVLQSRRPFPIFQTIHFFPTKRFTSNTDPVSETPKLSQDLCVNTGASADPPRSNTQQRNMRTMAENARVQPKSP